MSSDQEKINTLVLNLEKSISGIQADMFSATKFIQSIERTADFPRLLLLIFQNGKHAPKIRKSAAAAFYRFCKASWAVTERNQDIIGSVGRNFIKNQLPKVLFRLPAELMPMVSETISIIADSDFPNAWPNLLPDLIQPFDGQNIPDIRTGAIVIDIFLSKYRRVNLRNEQKMTSDIDFIASKIIAGDKFPIVLSRLLVLLNKPNLTPDQLKVSIDIITRIVSIIHSICSVDVPQKITQDFNNWFITFRKILMYRNPQIDSLTPPNVESILHKMQGYVLDFFVLIIRSQDRCIQETQVEELCRLSWVLLKGVTKEIAGDLITIKSMQLLTAVADHNEYFKFYSKNNALEGITKEIISPNLGISKRDIILYKNEPQKFIAFDLQGTDQYTRRRAAHDFVVSLCRHYEDKVISTYKEHISGMMKAYDQDPPNNWQKKNVAITLLSALAARAWTESAGVITIAAATPISPAYKKFLRKDLLTSTEMIRNNQNPNILPIIISDTLKFVTNFRRCFSLEEIGEIFDAVIVHLKHPDFVIRSYASNALYCFLTMKPRKTSMNTNPKLRAPEGFEVTAPKLKPHLGEIINGLIECVKRDGSAQHYAFRTLSRVIRVARHTIQPHALLLSGFLTKAIEQQFKHHEEAHYYHYSWDSIGALVRSVSYNEDGSINNASVSRIQDKFYPLCVSVVEQKVATFIPYVYQLYGILVPLLALSAPNGPSGPDQKMLSKYKTWPLPKNYVDIFSHIIQPENWKGKSNIAALTLLLQKYIHHAPQQIAAHGFFAKLVHPNGCITILLGQDSLLEYAFNIIYCIFRYVPRSILKPYFNSIVRTVANRHRHQPSRIYAQYFAWFTGFSAALLDNQFFIALEQVQKGFSKQLLLQIFAQNCRKIQNAGAFRRKTCIIGIMNVLVGTEAFFSSPETNIRMWKDDWKTVFISVIGMCERRVDMNQYDQIKKMDLDYVQTQKDLEEGIDIGFRRLPSFGETETEVDPFPQVTNIKKFILEQLDNLASKMPGNVTGMIKSLPPAVESAIMRFQAETNHSGSFQ